jgi:MoCo/4Fe-4S cofactor protein with predicted Tat translocation signal
MSKRRRDPLAARARGPEGPRAPALPTLGAAEGAALPGSAADDVEVQIGKDYWRSLDRILDSPAVREELAREFPEGADLPPDELSRRTVLKLMGASLGMAGLTACRRPVEHIVPFVDPPPEHIPGVPRIYASTMPLGTSAYGVLVTSHSGRPTKIEGNPLHPSSMGAASLLMQAAILDLYDPDRSRGVRQRGEPSDLDAFIAWWQERSRELEAAGGAGLAILADPFASPTLARLAAQLQSRYPAMRWVAWEPAGDGNAFLGHGGRRPLYHLERARVVLAADADLLLTESESLRHARGWAEGRELDGDSLPLRLYVVESSMTVTGSNADHRVPLQSRRIPAFLAGLAAELGAPVPEGGAGEPRAELDEEVLELLPVIARDLRAAGPGALVAAGRHQPPSAHATALAINRHLGAVGNTVTLRTLEDAAWGTDRDLAALADAIEAGEVETLIVVGGNPAWTAPADLGLAAAIEGVPQSVHLSLYADETSRRARWHLPQTHWLEHWGDARAADGTAGVGQPLIAPLHGGISPVELLELLASGEHRPGYEVVRETWRELAADPEAWERLLHDGVVPGELAARGPESLVLARDSGRFDSSAAPDDPDRLPDLPVGDPRPVVALLDEPAAPRADGYELVFRVSPRLHDGRFANNPWLQELPDPLTKTVWGNAARLAPATARELGVGEGDHLLVVHEGRRLALPTLIDPGQAEGSVAVELGYGQELGGRVARGVGRDVYRLRTSASPWVAGGVHLARTRGHTELVRTQVHGSLEGRNHLREATVAAYRADPGLVRRPEEGLKVVSPLFQEHTYEHGPQWGMVIDLSSCTGCSACIVACQAENNVPVVGPEQVARGREMHWLRIDRYYSGPAEDPEVAFQPVPCMHCENAPCEQVCPVAATVHDREGLNVMVYNRCIGTRYCSNNCPYKVRRFNFFNFTKDTPELLQMANNPSVTVRSRGVMEKCSYCLQRINRAKADAKREHRELADGDVRTACQQTCPTQAISFGDIRDPESRVAQLKETPRDYVVLAELNNRPRTSYLARLRNPNPEWPGGARAQRAVEAT